MTTLPTKITRDSIGITSRIQAIGWALLTLESVTKDPARKTEDPGYSYGSSVSLSILKRVVSDTVATYLSFTVDLPFDYPQSAKDSYEFIPYVKSFFNGNAPNWVGDSKQVLNSADLPITENPDNLTEEPNLVDSLEKFLLWVCIEEEKDLFDPWPASLPDLSIDPYPDNSNGAIIRIKGTIPFNYKVYRENSNLLFSLLPIGSPFPASGGTETVVSLDDLEDVNLSVTLLNASIGLVFDPVTNTWHKGTIVGSDGGGGLDYNFHISSVVTGNQITVTFWRDSEETINMGSFVITNGQDGIDGQDAVNIDHISTVTNGNQRTVTFWGDAEETINLGNVILTDGINGQNGLNIDHISTVANGNEKTLTFWGDVEETINLGSVILTDGVDGTFINPPEPITFLGTIATGTSEALFTLPSQGTISRIDFLKTKSGTSNLSFKINNTEISGLSNLSVSSVARGIDLALENNTFNGGDDFVVFNSGSNITDLFFVVYYQLD